MSAILSPAFKTFCAHTPAVRVAILTTTLAFIFSGCAHTQPTVHGIPNFGIVAEPANGQPGIYCGGEPTSEGNAYLQSIGVTRRVDLNSESPVQGTEKEFELIRIPISLGEQIFGYGLASDIPRAASAIRPGTFVNCQHGKNRTQTVVGYWLLTLGVSRERALEEMKHYGWSDSLPGLKWYWRTLCK